MYSKIQDYQLNKLKIIFKITILFNLIKKINIYVYKCHLYENC